MSDDENYPNMRNDNVTHYLLKPSKLVYTLPFLQLCYYCEYEKEEIKDLEYSSKIILPSSILENLTKYNNIKFPAIFHLKNDNYVTTVSCQEYKFGIEHVYIPHIIHERLHLCEGDLLELEYCDIDLDKATKLVIQPHTSNFLEIEDHKSFLEYYLNNYTIIEKGSMIVIPDDITINNLYLNVVDIEPANMVITIDTDIEISFMAPLDYVEPPKPPTPVPEVNPKNNDYHEQKPPGKPKFVPFSGKGHRLGGD